MIGGCFSHCHRFVRSFGMTKQLQIHTVLLPKIIGIMAEAV